MALQISLQAYTLYSVQMANVFVYNNKVMKTIAHLIIILLFSHGSESNHIQSKTLLALQIFRINSNSNLYKFATISFPESKTIFFQISTCLYCPEHSFPSSKVANIAFTTITINNRLRCQTLNRQNLFILLFCEHF